MVVAVLGGPPEHAVLGRRLGEEGQYKLEAAAGGEGPVGEEAVVARPDGKEALVPLVDEIVVEVDLEARRLVCDPPEGLFDL